MMQTVSLLYSNSYKRTPVRGDMECAKCSSVETLFRHYDDEKDYCKTCFLERGW